MMNTTNVREKIHGGNMKKIFKAIIMAILTLFLSACSFSIFDKPIYSETLNHISTVVMNANVKISTSTYRMEFFHKIEGPYRAFGSGVVFQKEVINNDTYYYVLTNAHVVDLDTEYNHEYEIEDIYNNTISAELILKDFEYDLAILKFKAVNELNVIELASVNPKINETVFSVGSPAGKHNIITAGKILSYIETDKVEYEVIVHDAFIHKGSSGGMLINQKYQLVGINTWGFTEQDETIDENFVKGGATPIEKILEFLEQLDN